MACVASNNNRFYVGAETTYGDVPAITAANRISAVSLGIRQTRVQAPRRDKTGSRTYAGTPTGTRTKTGFELETYMSSWSETTVLPVQSPLFRAALGGAAAIHAGGTVASATDRNVVFSTNHNLIAGDAVSFGGEIRFVEAVVNATTVQMNAPFSAAPVSGSELNPTAGFRPGESLGSVSLFDYWSPDDALQRIVNGAAVEQMKLKVNGDFHSFRFRGEGSDLLDSATFIAGAGNLESFPAEPELSGFDFSIIPGNLGQVWLGTDATQFLTLTEAEVTLDNNVDLRDREFGTAKPCCIVAGQRNVTVKFNLFQQDDDQTKALYQAAKQRSPVSVFFQLGQQAGQLFGIYMKSILLEVPEFNDRDTTVEWQFTASRAQGVNNDELFIAFA